MARNIEDPAIDNTIAKMVAVKLREMIRPAESGCPDSETLAAYFDRALADKELAVCENHLLTCLRCQSYMAELSRLGDMDEPLPVIEPEVSQATPLPEEEGGAWGYKLAWALPVLAVLIGAGIFYRQQISNFLAPPQETAEVTPAAAPEIPKTASSRDRTAKQEAAKEADKKSAATPSAQPAATPSPAAPSGGELTGIAISGSTATNERKAPAREVAKAQEAAAPAANVTAAAPQVLAETRAARTLDRAEQAPAPAPPSNGRALGAFAAPRKDSEGSRELRGVTVHGVAPFFSPKWRVSRRGVIQKADVAGGWTNVPSGVTADLFDISFAGPSAGWVVGHEGTVLRSTDGGATWSQVSSPIGEDLVHVSAESDTAARVSSRSGKVFSTSDGGRTWKSASGE